MCLRRQHVNLLIKSNIKYQTMWTTFVLSEQIYMIKVIQLKDIHFYLTDFQNIWIQSLSKEMILTNFQQWNPLIDIKIEEVVAQVMNLVQDISEIDDLSISKKENNIDLNVRSTRSNFTVKFKFNLSEASSDVFLKEITVPLIQTVKHLELCQNMLCTLIKKKDRELEEHTLEKGQISREDLITEKFDDSKLESIDDKSMLNTFGKSKTFWDLFTTKYGHIDAKMEPVKDEPWNHIKRKRKIYSSSSVTKKGKGIIYKTDSA